MKKKYLTISLSMAVILLVAILTIYSAFQTSKIVSIKGLEASMIVEDSEVMGFNVDATKLIFGKVPRGSSGMRPVTITNDNDFTVTIKLTKTGEISKFISFSENNFILNPSETKEVIVIATPNLETPSKTYTGTVKILTIK